MGGQDRSVEGRGGNGRGGLGLAYNETPGNGDVEIGFGEPYVLPATPFWVKMKYRFQSLPCESSSGTVAGE